MIDSRFLLIDVSNFYTSRMAENKHSTWSSRRIEPVLPEPGSSSCYTYSLNKLGSRKTEMCSQEQELQPRRTVMMPLSPT